MNWKYQATAFHVDTPKEVPVLDFEELEGVGVDPEEPTHARPGTEEKVSVLAARYAAGLPLWHQDDCYDHGSKSLLGQDAPSNPFGVELQDEEFTETDSEESEE